MNLFLNAVIKIDSNSYEKKVNDRKIDSDNNSRIKLIG